MDVLEKKIPLRLGANSDCFMAMDRSQGITLEMLRMLHHYEYPFLIVTRSELVSNDEYLKYMDKNLVSIHLSIPSLDPELTKILEPHTPSPETRLSTLKKLSDKGYWTTVRINPLFPIHPDGYYSNPEYADTHPPKLDFFSFDLIDAIKENGCKSILVGLVNLEGDFLEKVSARMNFDLKKMLAPGVWERTGKFAYSKEEIRAYFEQIKSRCHKHEMHFTTCYLGQGEPAYFEHQDLWDNKGDCCNVKDRIPGHVIDSKAIDSKRRFDYNHENQNPFIRLLTKACFGLIRFIHGKTAKN